MKKSVGAFVCLAGLMLTTLAQAGGGDISGNGGDAVVCQSGPVTIPLASQDRVPHAMLLDIYEGLLMRDIHPDLGDPSLDVMQKVEQALSRMHRLDPGRAERYLKVAQGFMKDTRMIAADLQDIPDSGFVPLPPVGVCKIVQAVVQKPRSFPEDKTFTIDRRVWDLFDNDSRAGLILHEIVYQELIQYGHTNSISARYFNTLLLSNRFSQIGLAEYLSLLGSVGFRHYNYHGMLISTDHAEFDDSGKLISFDLSGGQIPFKGGTVEGEGRGSTYLDGTVARLGGFFSVRHGETALWGGEITFYPSGELRTVQTRLDYSDQIIVVIQGKSVPVDIRRGLLFDREGWLKAATLIWDPNVQVNLVTTEGQTVSVAGGTAISLDRQGRLTHFKSLTDAALVWSCRDDRFNLEITANVMKHEDFGWAFNLSFTLWRQGAPVEQPEWTLSKKFGTYTPVWEGSESFFRVSWDKPFREPSPSGAVEYPGTLDLNVPGVGAVKQTFRCQSMFGASIGR